MGSNPNWSYGYVPTAGEWNNEWATKADEDNARLTGAPTAPTPAPSDNSTAIATTAWVKSQGYSVTGGVASPMVWLATVAALRANTTVSTPVFVRGFATDQDGGEGTFVWVTTDTTSADNVGTIIVDASGRRWHRVVSGQMCSAKWFGAKGDGSTNDTAAITSAFAAFSEVMLPPSTYVIGTNLTIANGKKLRLTDGAVLQVSGGITLTVNGQFDAPVVSIFTGSGSAVGMRTAYPEWWGATVDTGADCISALTKAHTAVQASANSDGDRPTIVLGAGNYSVSNTWTIQPTASCQLRVRGEGTIFNGTRFVTLGSFPSAPVIFVQGNSDSTQQICDWELTGFGIQADGGSPTIGLKVGSDNNSTDRLNGLQESLIEDVLVTNGAKGFPVGMQFCHVRLVTVRRCSVWSGTGGSGSASDSRYCILFTENGWFTGDIDLYNVQVVGTINANVIGLAFRSTVASSLANSVAGIRCTGLIGYTCDEYVQMLSQNGKGISDIWLNPGCQFDGGSIRGIYMQADGSGSFLQNIHIDGVYVDGANPGDLINVLVSNGGFLQDIWVVNNWLANAFARAVSTGLLAGTGAVYGLHIEGNQIHSCSYSSGEAIFLGNGTTDTICTHNIASRSADQAFSYFITVGNGSQLCIVTQNIGSLVPTVGVVNDLSGSVTKVVANNI